MDRGGVFVARCQLQQRAELAHDLDRMARVLRRHADLVDETAQRLRGGGARVFGGKRVVQSSDLPAIDLRSVRMDADRRGRRRRRLRRELCGARLERGEFALKDARERARLDWLDDGVELAVDLLELAPPRPGPRAPAGGGP